MKTRYTAALLAMSVLRTQLAVVSRSGDAAAVQPVFNILQRPGPLSKSCSRLNQHNVWVWDRVDMRTFGSISGIAALIGQHCGNVECRFPPVASTHTLVLTCQDIP